MSASFEGLKQLFGRTELPSVVSDSAYVLDVFRASGFESLEVSSVSSQTVDVPPAVLLVPAAPSIHPNHELLASLENSAVLVVPLLAFAYGESEIDYLIQRLSNLSFADSCERNRELLEYVQHKDGPITIEGNGCRLIVELGDEVDIMIPKVVPNIAIGEWISIIQYLEVGLVPNRTHSSFRVNGQLAVEGVTVAHHLHSHSWSAPIANEAWSLLHGLRSAGLFPLVLTIENSMVLNIVSKDGADFTGRLLQLTDEIMRGGLTEVAFGALEASDETDWTLNSQLNEPAGGFHVGIGAGESAAHIDFIAPRAVFS